MQEHTSTTTEKTQEGTPESTPGSWRFFVRSAALIGVDDHRTLHDVRTLTVLPGGIVGKRFSGGGQQVGGGVRGVVKGFSYGSRRRMRRLLMSLDWTRQPASWLTLTYSLAWPASWHGYKAHLRTFLARLKRKWPMCTGWLWRLEFQRRGAPHFHLVLFWKRGHRLPAGLLDVWCRVNWDAVLYESTDAMHLRHGAHVEDVHTDRGVARLCSYLVKELAKVMQAQDEPCGRLWGYGGELPTSAGRVLYLNAREWTAFLERVHHLPGAGQSWFLRSLSELWAGFTVMVAGAQLAGLVAGLGARGP